MKHLLAVDDDPDTLQIIAGMLGRRGYQVATASTGAEALEVMQSDLPDLVLLDIMMPRMDGYEVCRQMRADPHTAHVPVVMLSAKAEIASQVEAFRCGADGYLTKPVRSSELLASIEDTLERAAPPPPAASGVAIGIVGSHGGVGTTLVAVNVAVTLAAEQAVALADFAPNGAVIAHLGLETFHGIGALLSQPVGNINQATLLAEMVTHSSGLRVLGGSVEGAVNFDVRRARAILSVLLDAADVVIVDLGAGLSPVTRTVLPYCGAVALVVGSDRVALTQAQHVLTALLNAGVTREAILPVCVNPWGTVGELDEAAVSAVLGQLPCVKLDYVAEDLYQAIQQGKPLVLSAPESPAGQSMRTLAQELYRSAHVAARKEAQ